MFPESNAPAPSQGWVRNVTERASVVSSAASRTERNALALSGSIKSSYELVDNRIANIGSFTTGLFEQGMYDNEVSTFAALDSLPRLYTYTSGSFEERAAIVGRIPFARYNELTVTADGFMESFTTDVTATTIDITRPVQPMIVATIPPFPRMNADGSYVANSLSYDPRWTVESFEPFLNYNIPGNVVPTAYSSTYGSGTQGYHPRSGGVLTRKSRDGYTGYSMKYSRSWLVDYMQAILDYTNNASPPPAGARYYVPDINQIEIIVGYYYTPYTSATATNTLYVNDTRLQFTTGSTFVLEGVKNLGY